MCFFLVIYSSCLHSESQLNVPQNVSWLVLRKVGICGHAFVNVISCFIFKKKKKHLRVVLCLSSPPMYFFNFHG